MTGPYLEIQVGIQRFEFPLNQPRITIGRHEANSLVLADARASRAHCVIESSEDGFLLRDLNSSNGTRLNGEPVTTSQLSPGDVIAIGSTTMKLMVGAPAPIPGAPDELDELTAADLAEPDLVDLVPIENEFNEHEGGGGGLQILENADTEQTLEALAKSLPGSNFSEGDIALINARGEVTHDVRDSRRDRPAKRDTVDLLRLLLLVCFKSRTTDIHLESRQGFHQLRLRIDGSMVDICRVHQMVGQKIGTLIKVMCEVDIAHRNVIQEGHFSSRVPSGNGSSRQVDYRVSFAPSVYGQKCVIRILDTANAPLRAPDLNLPRWMLSDIAGAIKQEAGMVMVSGPTGSGKTTSLYALVRSIDVTRRNVVTIEDPVEIQLDGVTQIPVDTSQDKGFPQLLRSVLRQDPDVILVGEIRDADTARVAMQAAITGHLVFSTIHTKDTVGTIFRLLDLGVEPYLVAQGLHTVLAQRLARQLCPYCKRATSLTDEQRRVMGEPAANVSKIYVPAGCVRCLGTGYSGRRAFFELLRVNDELRDVILANPSIGDIQAVLAKQQFQRLSQTGFALVAEGSATFAEIERATVR